MGGIAELTTRTRHETSQMVDRFRALDVGTPALSPGGIAVGVSQLHGGIVLGEGAAERQYKHFKGWTYAAVRPIAQTIAGQAIVVGRLEAKRLAKSVLPRVRPEKMPDCIKAMGKVEVLEDHELIDVLENPNKLMTSWHLKYITAVSLEMTGKQHWWCTVEEDRPMIVPVPSSWIQPIHEEGKPFSRWALTPGGTGQPVPIPAEEVVYFYYPDPSDLLGAMSPHAAQAHAVSADEAIDKAQAQAFTNGIWPGLAVIAGEAYDEEGKSEGRPLLEHEQREQIFAAIKRHYGNVVHYGEPIILDRVIKDVKEITRGPREMDFVNSDRAIKSRITQGHGTNPAIMGEIEGLNRASSFAAAKHFADHTINPKIELLSQTMTKTLAPRMAAEGEQLVVYIEPYTPDDREQKRKDWELAARFAAVSRNELRQEILGLNPMIEGGDDMLAPMNTLPIPVRRPEVVRTKIARITTKQAHQQWLAAQQKLEKQMAAVLAGLFAAQRDSAVGRLFAIFGENEQKARGIVSMGAGLAELLFDPGEWYLKFQEALEPIILGAMIAGAKRALAWYESEHKQVGDIDDLLIDLDPNVSAAIRAEFRTMMDRPYWDDLQATTLNRLSAQMQAAYEGSEGLYEMAVRIGDAPTVPVPGGAAGVLGSESNMLRAMTIARTESGGAMNAGHFATQQHLAAQGLIQGKEWVALIDGYTRDSHRAAHGQKVPADKNFVLGFGGPGHEAPYPGHHGLAAGERINCRCTVISVHSGI